MVFIKCSDCGAEKEANTDNFRWRNDRNKYEGLCKVCEKEYKKNYNKSEKARAYRVGYNKSEKGRANRARYNKSEKGKKFRKEYNKSDKRKVSILKYSSSDKGKVQHKKWLEKNRAAENTKRRERLAKNPGHKLRRNVSGMINKLIRRHGGRKNGASHLKYVNWTYSELIKHLEALFEPGMTWENYGSYWEIDHIIPQSVLPYTSMEDDNFKKSWALSNLRPLTCHQNRSDGASKIRHVVQFQ
jgi:hypothetical protein